MSWWKWILGAWMLVVIWLAFGWAPDMMRPNYSTGQVEAWPSFRIVFFHVPAAWICVIALLVSMVASIRVLRGAGLEKDDTAMAAAQIGFLFGALALISGMIWARYDWGSFWNWDPRQSSVMILLLIYAGYFALRSSIADPHRRARLAAVYSIAAFVTVPFLIFVVPRIMFTLHPSPVIPSAQEKGSMSASMRVVLYSSVVGYIALYVWLMSLRVRMERLARNGGRA